MKKLSIFILILLLLPLKLFAMESREPEKASLEKLPLELILKVVKHLLPPKVRLPFKKRETQLAIHETITNLKKQYLDFIKDFSRLSTVNEQYYFALRNDLFLNSLALKIARRLPASYIVDDIINELMHKKIDPLFIGLFERVKELFEQLINSVKNNDIITTQSLLYKLKNSHFYISSINTLIQSVLKPSSEQMLQVLLTYDNPDHYIEYFSAISLYPSLVNDLYKKIVLGIKLNALPIHDLSIMLYTLISIFASENKIPSLKLIKLLIDSGADVNYTRFSAPLLMVLARKEQSNRVQRSLAQLLLENGADVNIHDNFGDSAYTYAIDENNVPLVHLLLEWTFPQAIDPQLLKDAIIKATQKNNAASKQILEAIDNWALENNFIVGNGTH